MEKLNIRKRGLGSYELGIGAGADYQSVIVRARDKRQALKVGREAWRRQFGREK